MPALLMVVDDDDDIRETYSDVLRDEGFEVLEAENGRHALEQLFELLAAGRLPALILLDQTMPVMDGRSFREAQLRDSALASIPVLLMTAVNASAVATLVNDLRPTAVVRKPIGFDALLAAIHAALVPPAIAAPTLP